VENQSSKVASDLLQADFLLGWFSTQNMETTCSSETSVHIRAARRFIQENDYCCEKLKSYKESAFECDLHYNTSTVCEQSVNISLLKWVVHRATKVL
jgi:hypothetical protein